MPAIASRGAAHAQDNAECSSVLAKIIQSSLGPNATLSRVEGGKGIYLREPGQPGLSHVGKDTLLRILGKVKVLEATQPTYYKRVVTKSPWIKMDPITQVKYLWYHVVKEIEKQKQPQPQAAPKQQAAGQSYPPPAAVVPPPQRVATVPRLVAPLPGRLAQPAPQHDPRGAGLHPPRIQRLTRAAGAAPQPAPGTQQAAAPVPAAASQQAAEPAPVRPKRQSPRKHTTTPQPQAAGVPMLKQEAPDAPDTAHADGPAPAAHTAARRRPAVAAPRPGPVSPPGSAHQWRRAHSTNPDTTNTTTSSSNSDSSEYASADSDSSPPNSDHNDHSIRMKSHTPATQPSTRRVLRSADKAVAAPPAAAAAGSSLPPPGSYYEYAGQRVLVPEWPEEPVRVCQRVSHALCAIIRGVLRDCSGLPGAEGGIRWSKNSLSNWAKEVLLMIRANISAMEKSDPASYAEIVAKSPWIEDSAWPKPLWLKTASQYQKMQQAAGTEAGQDSSDAPSAEDDTDGFSSSSSESSASEGQPTSNARRRRPRINPRNGTDDESELEFKPGTTYKYAGESVTVPQWPQQPLGVSQVPARHLTDIINEVLSSVSPAGGPSLRRGGGRGLSSWGKEVLLRVMAKVKALQKSDPGACEKVMAMSPWLDTDDAWANLWGKAQRRQTHLRTVNAGREGPDLCYLCLCYADNEAGQTTDVETSEDPSPVRRRQKTAVKDPRFTEPTQQQEQQRASRPARRAAAAVRAPVPAAAQPPASPSTEGPTFGPVFELDGVRIPVPSVWPKEMLMTKQPMAQPLSAIILRVVGPAPSIIQQPGQTSGYLQLGIGMGLAPEGQRILLTVKAKAMALRKTQPELYKEIMDASPWMDGPEWAGFLWSKVRNRITGMLAAARKRKREREQARDRDSSDETTSSGGGSDDTGSESEGGHDSGADIDERVKLPGPGAWFEFEGHRIRVPASWPLQPKGEGAGKHISPLLSNVFKTVLGDNPVAARRSGHTGRYLKLWFATGLAREGKRVLLEVMTICDKMRKSEPTSYEQILSKCPWLTLDNPDVWAFLWARVSGHIHYHGKLARMGQAMLDEGPSQAKARTPRARGPGAASTWFEYGGEKVLVPDNWPKHRLPAPERSHPRLMQIIHSVLGAKTVFSWAPDMEPGTRYLRMPGQTGLADEGKRIMLEISAKVQMLKRQEPELHTELLNRHPWLTTHDCTAMAKLWAKVYYALNNARQRGQNENPKEEETAGEAMDEDMSEDSDGPSSDGGSESESHGDSEPMTDGEEEGGGTSKQGRAAKRPRRAAAVAAAAAIATPGPRVWGAEEGPGYAAWAAKQVAARQQAKMHSQQADRKRRATHSGPSKSTGGDGGDTHERAPRPTSSTADAGHRVQTGADGLTLPQPPLPVPPPGGVYVFEGQSVRVPDAWPTEKRAGTEVLCPELKAVIVSVLHPHTRPVERAGDTSTPFLMLGRARGLTNYGKETMLRIMARVQRLKTADPAMYGKILEHHTWMTSEHPTFVARLWDKIANLLTNADRYGGLAAIPGIGRQLPVLQGLPVSNNNKPVSDHNRRVSDNNRPVSDSRLSSRFDTSAIEAAHQPRQQADSTAAAAAAVASPAAPAVPAGVPPAAGANAAPQPQPPQPPQRPDTQLQTLHTGGNASPGFVGRSMEAGPEAWGIPHAAHAAGSGMQPAAAAAAAVAPPVLPPLTAGLSPEALRLHGGQLLQQAGVQAQQGVGGEHAVGWGRAHGQMGGSSLQMGVSVGQYGLGWGPVLGTGAGVHAGMQQQAVPPPPALQPSHSAGPAGAAGWLASPAAGGYQQPAAAAGQHAGWPPSLPRQSTPGNTPAWGATAGPPAAAASGAQQGALGWGSRSAPATAVGPATRLNQMHEALSTPAFVAAAADAARVSAVRAAAWLPPRGSAAGAPPDASALLNTFHGVASGSAATDLRRLWVLDTLSDTLLRFGASSPAQSGSAAEVIRSASARIAALQTQVTSHTLHADTARALDFCVGALTRALMGGTGTELAPTLQVVLQVLCLGSSMS